MGVTRKHRSRDGFCGWVHDEYLSVRFKRGGKRLHCLSVRFNPDGKSFR